MESGIVGYGVSVPYRRIDVKEILAVWGNSSLEILNSHLRLYERGVLFFDEDTNTLAIEAARNALKCGATRGEDLELLCLGTGTNPWSSNPSSTIVAEAVGAGPHIMCSDIQFSGKSGTAAMQACLGLTESGVVKRAMAIGADTLNRHVAPGDLYEYTASAGAGALVLGKENVIARVKGMQSYSSSLADWFRIEGERYIKTSTSNIPDALQLGLVEHVLPAVYALNGKLALKPEDYTYAAFQQPYGFVPFMLGSILGFTPQQVGPGEVSESIGDCGAASSLLGLANILDMAKPGDRVLLASYGFGAGADAFCLEVTEAIGERRGRAPSVRDLLARKMMVDYGTAAKYEYKYLKPPYPTGPWT